MKSNCGLFVFLEKKSPNKFLKKNYTHTHSQHFFETKKMKSRKRKAIKYPSSSSSPSSSLSLSSSSSSCSLQQMPPGQSSHPSPRPKKRQRVAETLCFDRLPNELLRCILIDHLPQDLDAVHRLVDRRWKTCLDDRFNTQERNHRESFGETIFAIKHGHFDLFKWLLIHQKHEKLRTFQCKWLNIACSHGRHRMIDWFMETFAQRYPRSWNPLTIKLIHATTVAAAGHVKALAIVRKWIEVPLSKELVYTAYQGGSSEMIQNLMEQFDWKTFCFNAKRAMVYAAVGGHLHLVRELVNVYKEPPTARVLARAAEFGHRALVEWIVCTHRDCSWGSTNFEVVVKKGHFQILDLYRKFEMPSSGKNTGMPTDALGTVERGDLVALDALNSCGLLSIGCPSYVHVVNRHDEYDKAHRILNWLWDRDTHGYSYKLETLETLERLCQKLCKVREMAWIIKQRADVLQAREKWRKKCESNIIKYLRRGK